MPNRKVMTTSITLLLMLYVPTRHSTMMMGNMIRLGTWVSLAQKPAMGRFMNKRSVFPMNMLAMTAQTTSGFSWNSMGPG